MREWKCTRVRLRGIMCVREFVVPLLYKGALIDTQSVSQCGRASPTTRLISQKQVFTKGAARTWQYIIVV